jgi:hypothetical protein
MLKLGAIGSIFALRFALTRRNRDQDDAAVAEPPGEPARAPHPVSRKKKKRRRRG